MPRRLEIIAEVDVDGHRAAVRDLLLKSENLLVLFINAKGAERHMLCRYEGARSQKAHLLTVHDVALGRTRTVNLDTTYRIVDPKTDTILFDLATA